MVRDSVVEMAWIMDIVGTIGIGMVVDIVANIVVGIIEDKFVGIMILVWLYDTYVVLDGNPLISDDKL